MIGTISNDRHLIHRHRGNYCTNCVLVFALFTIILLLLVGASNCSGIPQKQINFIYTLSVIGKCHKELEINLVYFIVAQFHSMKAMS